MEHDPAEKPPVFSSWRDWYLLVMGVLFAEIIGLLIVTKAFE